MSTQPHSSPPLSEVIIEKLLNGQVTCLTITSSSRTAIDQYVEAVKEAEKDWTADHVGYFICDTSAHLAGFNTPYGRWKMRELMALRPELTTYTAVVITNNFMVQIARIALNNIPRKRTHTHLCFTRKEALEWIEKMIAKESAAQVG